MAFLELAVELPAAGLHRDLLVAAKLVGRNHGRRDAKGVIMSTFGTFTKCNDGLNGTLRVPQPNVLGSSGVKMAAFVPSHRAERTSSRFRSC